MSRSNDQTVRRRLLAGILTISLVLSGIGSALYFLAVRRGEREEISTWLQATAIQLADTIAQDGSLPTSVPKEPPDLVQQRIRTSFEALRREIDGLVGRPIIESSEATLWVGLVDADGKTARTIGALNADNFGKTWTIPRGWEQRTPFGAYEIDDGRGRIAAVTAIRDPRLDRPALVRFSSNTIYLQGLVANAALAASLIFILAAGYSILFARRFSRSLTEPIDVLVHGMNSVADGKLNVEVRPETPLREFRELSTNFNEMVRGLRDRVAIRKEVSTAASVQRVLLPQELPTIEGYSVAGQATYHAELGGDYFDVFHIGSGQSNNEVALLLADVAGHDIGSSLMMSAVQAIARSACATDGTDPFSMNGLINDHLLRHDFAGRFVSAFFAVLDQSRHELRWTSAGHEPALLFSASTGGVSQLLASMPPLGVIEDLGDSQPHTARLEPGDVLLIATDGVREHRGASGEMFGIDRMSDLLGRHAQLGPQGVIERIREAMREFAGPGSTSTDDVTMIVLRRDTA
ncbi:MAG: PP2C family protein-serine/threonine phosphatase [Phycisphaerales bacterium]|nr:PP2C family protein-serine/threonine phosphatase [Phycisphaerales bacterium]